MFGNDVNSIVKTYQLNEEDKVVRISSQRFDALNLGIQMVSNVEKSQLEVQLIRCDEVRSQTALFNGKRWRLK